MQRVFTKDIGINRDRTGARYPVGMTANWPVQTWKGIATSLGVGINDFSRPLEEAVKDWANPLPPVIVPVIDPSEAEEAKDTAPKPPPEPVERKKRGRKPGKAKAQARLKQEAARPTPTIPKEGSMEGHTS